MLQQAIDSMKKTTYLISMVLLTEKKNSDWSQMHCLWRNMFRPAFTQKPLDNHSWWEKDLCPEIDLALRIMDNHLTLQTIRSLRPLWPEIVSQSFAPESLPVRQLNADKQNTSLKPIQDNGLRRKASRLKWKSHKQQWADTHSRHYRSCLWKTLFRRSALHRFQPDLHRWHKSDIHALQGCLAALTTCHVSRVLSEIVGQSRWTASGGTTTKSMCGWLWNNLSHNPCQNGSDWPHPRAITPVPHNTRQKRLFVKATQAEISRPRFCNVINQVCVYVCVWGLAQFLVSVRLYTRPLVHDWASWHVREHPFPWDLVRAPWWTKNDT